MNVAGPTSVDPDGDQLTYTATSQPDRNLVSRGRNIRERWLRFLDLTWARGTVVGYGQGPRRAERNPEFQRYGNGASGRRVRCAPPQVRDAILAAVGVTECASVTGPQLAGIDSLDVSESGLSRLQEGDFELLPKLTVLRLGGNQLSELPQTVFSDLSSLESLDLSNNRLQEFASGRVRRALEPHSTLELHGNHLSRLPDGAFSGLSRLRVLGLDANRLSQLSQDLFSGLSNLESLNLWQNSLQELPADVFANLSSLRKLDFHANQLSELPRTVFSGLSNLESLQSCRTTNCEELPEGVFSRDSPDLKELRLECQSAPVPPARRVCRALRASDPHLGWQSRESVPPHAAVRADRCYFAHRPRARNGAGRAGRGRAPPHHGTAGEPGWRGEAGFRLIWPREIR